MNSKSKGTGTNKPALLNGDNRFATSRRCGNTNRSGKRCGAWSIKGKDKCALHLDPERASRLGSKRVRKGGQQPEPLTALMSPPKSASDVRDALAAAMAQVHDQKMNTKTANALAYVATSLLRAIELSDLENRLLALERTKEDGGVIS
jgi:hypothetical protein